MSDFEYCDCNECELSNNPCLFDCDIERGNVCEGCAMRLEMEIEKGYYIP